MVHLSLTAPNKPLTSALRCKLCKKHFCSEPFFVAQLHSMSDLHAADTQLPEILSKCFRIRELRLIARTLSRHTERT